MLTRPPLLAALAAIVATAVLSGCDDVDAADEAAGTEDAGAGDAQVEVVMDEMAYEPERIEVPAGEQVTVRLVNEGTLRHDLVLPGGTESPTVQPGESDVVELGPLESSTTGWCSVPGHRAQGMELMIDVVD